MLLDADPPIHTWQRRLLQKAWTPRLDPTGSKAVSSTSTTCSIP